MTTNPHTTGRRIEGWLTQPPAHHKRPSEVHASAVRVLRMVNSSHQHTAAEPVPFRPLSAPRKPAPLRSIQPARASKAATPAPHQPTGCAGHGGHCIGPPDCSAHQCPAHPDHDDTVQIPRHPKPIEMVSFGQRDVSLVRSVFGWIAAAAMFALLAAAIVLMGNPQDH